MLATVTWYRHFPSNGHFNMCFFCLLPCFWNTIHVDCGLLAHWERDDTLKNPGRKLKSKIRPGSQFRHIDGVCTPYTPRCTKVQLVRYTHNMAYGWAEGGCEFERLDFKIFVRFWYDLCGTSKIRVGRAFRLEIAASLRKSYLSRRVIEPIESFFRFFVCRKRTRSKRMNLCTNVACSA